MAVVDVDDVVEGILRAWEKGRTGERYILCADNYTYRDLGRLFASYQDRRGPMIDMPRLLLQGIARVSEAWARITHHPPRLTGAMARMATIRLFCSNAKAQNALGMTFRPFPDTARRTIEWYRRHQR
ncbi:MAG: hypothetical protein HY543_07095 [Deltaproteobacteria bacterium]|nr:hypothetical protein [Deltaproteobacteria bacterium]